MKIKYITEETWHKIYTFLKSRKEIYVRCVDKVRRFISGVLWIMRTGAQWREVPEKFGKWNSVFARFNEWSKKHIWEALMKFCITDPDLEWVVIDATIVRAHACASGYKKDSQEQQHLGRSKGGFTTKIHIATDALGLPLTLLLSPGNRNDITQASALVADVHNTEVIGDKGYDSDPFRNELTAKNCTATIPPRSNRKNPATYDKHTYVERHVVECLISKLKQFRRIFSRFDKSALNYASFLAFAGTLLWLR